MLPSLGQQMPRLDGYLTPFGRADKAKQLLEAIVNLPDGSAGFKRFQQQFPEVLCDLPARKVLCRTADGEFEYYTLCISPESKYENLVIRLRDTLRGIWRAKSRRSKESMLLRIPQEFFLRGSGSLIDPPGNPTDSSVVEVGIASQTEKLISRLWDWLDRTRYCKHPKCVKRYFIARHGYKYCGDVCRNAARREANLNSYKRTGRERRKKRRTSLPT